MQALRGGLLGAGRMSAVAPVRRAAVVSVAPRPSFAGVYVSPSCSFLGGSFCGAVMRPNPSKSRGALVVVANGKRCMGATNGGTNRKRKRVSGFRKRLSTAAGRAVLKARRARGRHVLSPVSMRKSGGKK